MPRVEPMDLVYSLVGFPSETEWLEFKRDNTNPETIARDISALANSAAYHGRDVAYKVWGVNDASHELVGTSFDPNSSKKGNVLLPIWLKQVLTDNASYDFSTATNGPLRFVILAVRPAIDRPVYYDGKAYIREGSSTTQLTPGSAKEQRLWHRLQRSDYESRIALEGLVPNEISYLLDVEAHFRLLGDAQPSTIDAAMVPLCEQGLVRKQDDELFSITNLGMLLIARRISSFPGARHHVLRATRFAGNASLDILDRRDFDKGYALALSEAVDYVMSSVPSKDQLDGAFRRITYAYPKSAIRELLSNVVAHQDLADAQAGPRVSIYENRIEFSNPGASLIPTPRLLNAQPKTRNKELVSALRRMGLCEESGTGWDRIVAACEQEHMLAPKVDSSEDAGTNVTLYTGIAYDRMTKRERIDATYWHACLKYSQGESMSNQTLRERFGLPGEKKSLVAMSRLIRECCNEGLIKEEDPDAGARYRRYIPKWA